jgi:uncharacterized repeat protein (TIGR01451 family)
MNDAHDGDIRAASTSERRLRRLAKALGIAASLMLTATAPTWAQVSFSKSFTNDPVMPGGTVTLEYTITNSGIAPLAALNFTDDYAAALSGLSAVGLPALSLCGVVSVLSGTSTLTLVSGALLSGQTCAFDITLSVPAGATPGTYPSTSSNLRETLLNVAGPATDDLVVTAPPAPTFTKAFSPTAITVGGTSTLTFTVDNSGSTLSATALDFSDTLPSGVEIAAAPSASTTCTGGALTATGGTTLISYSGGTVGANAICTVQVNVTATSANSFLNTSGDLTSSLGNSGPASATLDASAGPVPPAFSKAFSPSSVAVGSVSTLTFTINNSGNPVDADSLDFSDTLPAGVEVGAPNASTTCTGGALTATGGTTLIGYSGGSVAAGDSCTVDVDVVANTPGGHVNTTGDLTSSLGNSGPASATLTGTASTLGFTKAFSPSTIPAGEITTLTFTIDNSANAATATALAFADNLPSGLQIAATPNIASTCTGGTMTAVAGSALFDYLGGAVGANAICTLSVDILATAEGSYANVSGALTSSLGNAGTASATLTVGISNDQAVSQTQSVIRHFMSRRADLITIEDPDLTERLAQDGPRLPVDVQASYTPDGTELNFSTSLSQLRGAMADLNAAYSDEAKSLRALGYTEATKPHHEPPRFDIWTQGTYTSYRDIGRGDDQQGSFGLVYLGGEWRARRNLVIGVLAQFDATEESDDSTGIGASGTGWMAGPYVAGKFADASFFQLRGAYGRSSNNVSPFGTYDDDFETTRWLISGKFKQRFMFGPWRFTPTAGLIYFNEEQHDYVDENGLTIPSQTVALGRLTIGPEIAYRGEWSNGVFFEPSLGLTGIWDFVTDETDGPALDGDVVRARLNGSLAVGNAHGGRFSMTAFYDGICRCDFRAYGGTMKLSMPLTGD